MRFPAYPSYRESGVDWFGEVPSHWKPVRLRFHAELNPSKSEIRNIDSETEVSFVPMEAIGEKGELSLDQTRPLGEVLNGYTYFRNEDVAIAKITPCFENGKGAVMRDLSGGFGFGTTELIVTRARPGATTPAFLDWLFRSPAFRERGEASMYGAGGQKRVPDNFVRDFATPGPPLDEQVTIASFLDRETSKIDSLVDEQRRLISLLKEKRQAVISHAVTKGLNPYAPMKPSGIEWLGEVPAHWDVKRLRFLCDIGTGDADTADAVDDGAIPFFVRSPIIERIDAYTHDCEAVLTAGDGAGVGKVYHHFEGKFRAHQRVYIFSKFDGVLGRFFYSYMSEMFAKVVLEGTAKSTVESLRRPLIADFWITVPPMTEQCCILGQIKHDSERLDELTLAAEAAIRLLDERRAALISAAVTGKIDVRGSAKVLAFPTERARARGLIAAEIIERSAQRRSFGRVKLQKIAFLAEAHVGVGDLAGIYTREAAGPLDRAMIDDMEREAGRLSAIAVEQPDGSGTPVAYRLGPQRGSHRQELASWLGTERQSKLDKLIDDFATIETKGAEAVATLYAVWNDALIAGQSADDAAIIAAFLTDWHPEKPQKFRAEELHHWLDWMRRHGLVPTGRGPKTETGRLFV